MVPKDGRVMMIKLALNFIMFVNYIYSYEILCKLLQNNAGSHKSSW